MRQRVSSIRISTHSTERFRELTSLLDLSQIPLVHLGSGIALMAHKKPDIATATRMGLMMYGYSNT